MQVEIYGNASFISYLGMEKISNLKDLLKKENMQKSLCVKLRIDADSINDDLCDAAKYAMKKISNIKLVTFIFGGNVFNYDSILKLLHIFNRIDNIELCPYILFATDYIAFQNIISFFLRNLNTEKLFLDVNISSNEQLINLINENIGISSIGIAINRVSDIIPSLKIDEIHVYCINTYSMMTKHSVTEMFKIAPNLNSLKINVTRYYMSISNLSLAFIGKEALEEIMNQIIFKNQFDKLTFYDCRLTSENIKYICNKLVDFNIKCIKLKNFYNNESMYCICGLIKNNTHLKTVEIRGVESCHQLISIVEATSDTKITSLTIDICLIQIGEKEKGTMCNRLTQILSENYFLTHVSITDSVFCNEVYQNVQNITDRNIELARQRRFRNTKKAV